MATKKAIPRNSSVPQKAKARSSTTGPAGRKPTRSSKVLPHPSIPGSLHEARLLAETVKAQVTHHEKYWMENVQQLLDKVREDVGHRKSPADKGEVSQPKYMTLDWLLKTEAGRRQFDHGVSGQEIEWLLQAVRKDKQDTTKEVAVLLVQVLSDVGRMAWMFGMLDGLASLPAVTSHTALEAVFRHRGQGKGSEQRDKSGGDTATASTRLPAIPEHPKRGQRRRHTRDEDSQGAGKAREGGGRQNLWLEPSVGRLLRERGQERPGAHPASSR